MKKNLLKVLCWEILALCMMMVYYKIPVKNQIQHIAPAVEFQDPQTPEVPVNAFSLPKLYFEQGNYEVQVTYSCEENQTAQFVRYVDKSKEEKEYEIIGQVELNAEANTANMSFDVNENQMGQAVGGFILYSGEGLLEIKQVSYMQNGNSVFAIDAKNIESHVVGSVDGKVTCIPQLAATFSYSDIPTTKGFGIETNVIDPAIYMCQVIKTGDNNWQFLLYDSSVDRNHTYVDLEGADNCRLLLYKLGEQTQNISFEVNNASLITNDKKVVIGLLGLLVFIGIMAGTLILLKKEKYIHTVLTICAAGAFAVASVIWGYVETTSKVLDILLLFTILITLLMCILKEWTKTCIADCREKSAGSAWGAGIIAIGLSMFLLYQMLTSKEGSLLYRFNPVYKMNLVDYFLIVVLMIVLFLILNFFMQKKPLFVFRYGFSFGREEICLLFLVVCFFINGHFKESPVYLLLAIYVLYVGIYRWKSFPGSKYAVYATYAGTTALWFIANCPVNMFKEDMHHGAAYLSPLYNVTVSEAFAGGKTDLYGHYPLFFKPLFKLFGSSSWMVGICMAVICAVCAVCLLIVIHHLVQSDFLRIVGALIVAGYGVQEKLFLQVFPHRDIFPFILLAVITCWAKKDLKIWHRIVGLIICALSLVWNMESGAVTCLAWLVFCILKQISGKDHSFGKALLQLLKYVLIFGGIGVVGYGFIGIYNYLNNGHDWQKALNLSAYFGVLTNPDYMIGFHQTPLSWENDSWIYIMMLFVGGLLYALSKTGLVGKAHRNEHSIVVAIICVEGLGLMTYFMNRVSMGWGITLPFVALLVAIGLDYFSRDLEIKPCMSVITLIKHAGRCVLILIAAVYILSLPQSIQTVCEGRIKDDTLCYQELTEQLDIIRKEVPENTWARGDGTGYLYTVLGWNRHDGAEQPDTQYILSDENEEAYWGMYRRVKTYDVGYCQFTLYYNSNYQELLNE